MFVNRQDFLFTAAWRKHRVIVAEKSAHTPFTRNNDLTNSSMNITDKRSKTVQNENSNVFFFLGKFEKEKMRMYIHHFYFWSMPLYKESRQKQNTDFYSPHFLYHNMS